MDDMSSQPDLHDFLRNEDDSPGNGSLELLESPERSPHNSANNDNKITTPAKVLMVGGPVHVKTELTENEDDVMTDTTTSAAEISGSSAEELADGIDSPSPEMAAAMENACADEDFASASPKLGEVPKLPLNSGSKILLKPQTSIMASIKANKPISLAGKKFTIATQPVQVIKKEGGGGPIVTKYIVKRSNSSTVASQKPQVVMAKPQQTSSTAIKTITGGSIVLSPIKGGFKIPISPMKSPIKVSVIAPNSKKINRAQSKPYTIPIQTSLSQLHLKTQMVSTTTANTATLVNGVSTPISKTQQQIIVQNATSPNSSQPHSNPVVQHINVIPSPGAMQETQGVKYQYVQLLSPNSANQPSSIRSNQGQPITFTSMAPLNGRSAPLAQPPGTLTFIQPGTQKYQVATSAKSRPQTVKIAIPSQTSQQTSKPQQRLIMPATNLHPIRPNVVNLAPGAILPGGNSNVGYAMVPAKYVEQLTKQLNNQASFAPEARESSNTGSSIQKAAPPKVGSNGKLRKPCNCTKSQCLKLYCECFANGQFCDDCNCVNCSNNLQHEVERSKAIKQCLERNPAAFRPKIGRGKDDNRTHQKGCNCKRSGCLKNYCECYEARIPCTSKCKCIGCKNYEESNDRRTLMSLADAAAVRVQQQTAAKTKLSNQIGDVKPTVRTTSSGERLPYTFFTQEVIEATCTCLLAQAEEAEKTHRSIVVAEAMILEEFGRCIMQIIQSAGKAKVPH